MCSTIPQRFHSDSNDSEPQLLALNVPLFNPLPNQQKDEISKLSISVLYQKQYPKNPIVHIKLPYHTHLRSSTQSTYRRDTDTQSDESGRNVYIFVDEAAIYQYTLNNSAKISFYINDDTIFVCLCMTEAHDSFEYELSNYKYQCKTSDKARIAQSIESKLVSFIPSNHKDIDLKLMTKCFKDNDIDFMYFVKHKRKDLTSLMKTQCALSYGTAIKLWNHFIIDLNDININEYHRLNNDIEYDRLIEVNCKCTQSMLYCTVKRGINDTEWMEGYDDDESAVVLDELQRLESVIASNKRMIESLSMILDDIENGDDDNDGYIDME